MTEQRDGSPESVAFVNFFSEQIDLALEKRVGPAFIENTVRLIDDDLETLGEMTSPIWEKAQPILNEITSNRRPFQKDIEIFAHEVYLHLQRHQKNFF